MTLLLLACLVFFDKTHMALTIFTIFLDLSALLVTGMTLLFTRHRSIRKSKVEALLNERKDWPIATCDPPDCDCEAPDELYDEYSWYDDTIINGDDGENEQSI